MPVIWFHVVAVVIHRQRNSNMKSQGDTCGSWVEQKAAGAVEMSQMLIKEHANLRRRLMRIKKR